MSRRQIEEFIFLNGKTDKLEPGMVVFKVYNPGDAKYNLPAKYKSGEEYYDKVVSDKDVYHTGIVMSVNPLEIYHYGTGKTDTTLGNWKYCGKLKCIDYSGKEEPKMEKQIIVSTTGGTLNMRITAFKTATILEKIPNGTKLTAQEEQGDFYKVTYNGKQGYVMKEFVKEMVPPVSDNVTLTLPKAVAEELLKALRSTL